MNGNLKPYITIIGIGGSADTRQTLFLQTDRDNGNEFVPITQGQRSTVLFAVNEEGSQEAAKEAEFLKKYSLTT